MKIDKLITELTKLRDQGAEEVSLYDYVWNEWEIDNISTSSNNDAVLQIVSPDIEEEEEE